MTAWKYLVFFLLSCNAQLSRADSEEDSSEQGVASIKGPKATNCTCGVANREDQRIVGGVETKVNEYPYMAGLIYKPKKVLFCGGTVITRRHVLTAAHCIEPMDNVLKDLQVVLGEHDQEKVDESPDTVYMDLERAVMHPDYFILGHKNDIAMLVTVESIVFSRNVGPVCLPNKPISVEGKRLKVLGWGKLSANGPESKVLMKVMLNVVSMHKCNATYSYIDMEDIVQICTFHPTKDSCQGDSGGPLLLIDEETNRYVLAGQTSFGKSCAAGFPAINVDLSKYLEWIQYSIARTVPSEQTCSKISNEKAEL